MADVWFLKQGVPFVVRVNGNQRSPSLLAMEESLATRDTSKEQL